MSTNNICYWDNINEYLQHLLIFFYGCQIVQTKMRWCRILHLNWLCPLFYIHGHKFYLEIVTFDPKILSNWAGYSFHFERVTKLVWQAAIKMNIFLFQSAPIAYSLLQNLLQTHSSSRVLWIDSTAISAILIQNVNDKFLDSSKTLFPTPKSQINYLKLLLENSTCLIKKY